jgi:hypothetical protein
MTLGATTQLSPCCLLQELEARLKGGLQEAAAAAPGMLRALIDTILGNLQLRITNVHVRYEDTVSNPGHEFAVGVMLQEISAQTVDANGKPAFITTNVLQTLRKVGAAGCGAAAQHAEACMPAGTRRDVACMPGSSCESTRLWLYGHL